jgi:hypothetical protein
MLLLKNSGHTRFDHGTHGACCMTCFSIAVYFALTAGVRIGAFLSASISLLIFLLLK